MLQARNDVPGCQRLQPIGVTVELDDDTVNAWELRLQVGLQRVVLGEFQVLLKEPLDTVGDLSVCFHQRHVMSLLIECRIEEKRYVELDFDQNNVFVIHSHGGIFRSRFMPRLLSSLRFLIASLWLGPLANGFRRYCS